MRRRKLPILWLVALTCLVNSALLRAQSVTWRTEYVDTTTFFVGLDGADSLHYVVAGWTPSENYLVRTTDGGSTWRRIAIDTGYTFDGRYIHPPPIHAVEHPTPTTAVAVGDSGVVYVTSDAGSTWESARVALKARLQYISMLDSAWGVLVMPVGKRNYLAVTSDGGRTWDSIDSPPSAPDLVSITAVEYPDPTTFVCAWQNANRSGISVTNDAGASWDHVDSPFGDTISRIYLSFVDRDNGWAAVGRWHAINSSIQQTMIFRTTDGGRTWQKQFDSLSGGEVGPTGIEFHDENNGMMVGTKQVYRTSDGGETWRFERDDRPDSDIGGFFVSYPPGGPGLVVSTFGRILRHVSTSAVDWRPNRGPLAGATILQDDIGTDGDVDLRLTTSAASTATIRLFDVAGRVVGESIRAELKPGVNVLTLSVSKVPGGTYFVGIEVDGLFKALPLQIVR